MSYHFVIFGTCLSYKAVVAFFICGTKFWPYFETAFKVPPNGLNSCDPPYGQNFTQHKAPVWSSMEGTVTELGLLKGCLIVLTQNLSF